MRNPSKTGNTGDRQYSEAYLKRQAKRIDRILRKSYPSQKVAEAGISKTLQKLDPNGSYKAVEDQGDPGPDGPYWRIVKG